MAAAAGDVETAQAAKLRTARNIKAVVMRGTGSFCCAAEAGAIRCD